MLGATFMSMSSGVSFVFTHPNGTPLTRSHDKTSRQAKYRCRCTQRDVEAGVTGLDELAAPPPDENPEESPVSYHRNLEDERDLERRERLLMQLYSNSWLVFFSILGTLARLGVEWITHYSNAPVTTNVLWANFDSSLFLGFLQEGRALFAEQRSRSLVDPLSTSSRTALNKEQQTAQAEHLARKETLPLYIGLSVGFCAGSTGWSVCSSLSIAITEVAVSISALTVGAHLSIALLPVLSKVSKVHLARYMNLLGVFLGLGCWLGAIFLAIWPPQNKWLFGLSYDLQRVPLSSAEEKIGGDVLGCQILTGITEGFCGCLSTVSTWVAELSSMKKHDAYVYGTASIGVGFSLLTTISVSLY
ncbi:hypothetical protein K505DRAFT_346041 [Melanomma pulvis-pyrius CBS 109.77]|uniref:Uncharacterized protein n=1 Tax=Melanomma pulvis-pyrius CBS 109.77 TaxID=1314802 RepID=A0A6A6XUG7_9PLEO|nr:hypothetical protein K505DRAFT_346041 [Melanomma pulvis-pyrius CBS 109.77]